MTHAASEWKTALCETNEREKMSGPRTNPFFSHCAGRSKRIAAGVRSGCSLTAKGMGCGSLGSTEPSVASAFLRSSRVESRMLSLEPELVRLRDDGLIEAGAAAQLIATERRDAVSIYPDLRLLTWAGVM